MSFVITGGFILPDSEVFAEPKRYKRSIENYTIPDVVLVNQDGVRKRLKDVLDPDKHVMVDFIYATCTTICPVLSAGFSNFQNKFVAESENVQLVSFSIDPEHDTPKIMKDYLGKFRRKAGWDFFTGSREDINRVMNAFDAFTPDKMSHKPVMFMKAAGETRWVRIYGLIGTSELLEEYRLLGAK